MKSCIACILKSDQKEYEVEDIISDGDTATKCENPAHREPELVSGTFTHGSTVVNPLRLTEPPA
jgi:hypothetical protein